MQSTINCRYSKHYPDRWKDDDVNYRLVRRLNMLMVPYKIKSDDLRGMVSRRWNRPCDIDIAIQNDDYHIKLTHIIDERYQYDLDKFDNITVFLNRMGAVGILREKMDAIEWIDEDPLFIALGVFVNRNLAEWS